MSHIVISMYSFVILLYKQLVISVLWYKYQSTYMTDNIILLITLYTQDRRW